MIQPTPSSYQILTVLFNCVTKPEHVDEVIDAAKKIIQMYRGNLDEFATKSAELGEFIKESIRHWERRLEYLETVKAVAVHKHAGHTAGGLKLSCHQLNALTYFPKPSIDLLDSRSEEWSAAVGSIVTAAKNVEDWDDL